MRYKLYLFVVVILCFAVANQILFAEEPQEKRVKEVKVVNNKAVSSSTILAKLKTRKGIKLSQEMLNEDLKRLYGLGFFEDIAIDVQEEEDGYIVSFAVVEKPVIDVITFEGNKTIKTDRLKQEIKLKEDEMLDLSKLNRDLTAIRKLYESHCFQLANVDYKLETDDEINRAKIKFTISEKARVKVKRIDFFGNYSISEGELKKFMVTKTEFLFFIQPGYFKAGDFDADIDRLALYYKDKGYLDAKVEPDLEYGPDGTEM